MQKNIAQIRVHKQRSIKVIKLSDKSNYFAIVSMKQNQILKLESCEVMLFVTKKKVTCVPTKRPLHTTG